MFQFRLKLCATSLDFKADQQRPPNIHNLELSVKILKWIMSSAMEMSLISSNVNTRPRTIVYHPREQELFAQVGPISILILNVAAEAF